MKYHRILAAVLAAATLFTGATALAAGTAADPLVSRSWLKDIFNTPLETYVQTALTTFETAFQAKIEGLQAAAETYARQKVAAEYAADLTEAVQERVAELLAADTEEELVAGMETRTVAKGDKITGPAGASVMFVSGMGRVIGPAGSEILNVTAGEIRVPGPDIRAGILYMMLADDGSGIEVTSDTAVVLVKDGARAGYEVQYEKYANALNLLGMFRGSDKGYELERSPNRQEALIMLIRLLGQEAAALAGDTASPFLDLGNWEDGKRYVAYGYRMGYTNGTGATTFGTEEAGTLEQYLTFVLRALGYRDGVDFVWDTTSRDLAVRLGLLTAEELTAIGRDGFKRDHVVLISYRALNCQLQDGTGTLGYRLILGGVTTPELLRAAAALVQ